MKKETALKQVSQFAEAWGQEPKDYLDNVISTHCIGLSGEQVSQVLSTKHLTGLDIMAKEIMVMTQRGKMEMSPLIAGFTKIAHRDGIVSVEDHYSMLDNDLCCTVKVGKLVDGTIHYFSRSAFLSEYQQKSPIWKKMPRHMLWVRAYSNAVRLSCSVNLVLADELEDVGFVSTSGLKPSELTETTGQEGFSILPSEADRWIFEGKQVSQKITAEEYDYIWESLQGCVRKISSLLSRHIRSDSKIGLGHGRWNLDVSEKLLAALDSPEARGALKEFAADHGALRIRIYEGKE